MNPFGGSLNPSAQPFNPTGFAAAAPTSAFAQPAFGGFGGAAPASFGAAPAACGGNPFGGGGAFDGAPAVAADGVFGARGAVFGGAAAVAPRAFGAIFGGAPGGAGAFGGGATTPFGGRQTQQAPAAVFGSSAGVGTFGGGGSAGSSTFGGGGSSGTSMFGRPSGGSTFGGGAASGGSAFGGGSSGSSAFGGGAASRGSAFGGGAASGSCAFGGSSSGGGALGGGASSSGSGFGGGAASGSSMFGGGDKAALGGSMFDGGSSGGGAFGGGSGGGGKRAGPSAFGGTVAASKGTSFGCPPERPPFGGAPRGRSRSPPADQQPFGARAWPPSIPADQPYGGGPRGGDRGGGGNSGSKRVSFQPAAGGAAVGAPAAAASTDKMWVRQPAAPRAAHRELGPHEAPREAAAATPGGAFDRRDKSRRPAAAAGAAASVRVSRLPAHVDEAALQRAFEVYGPVRSAKVMTTAGGAPRGMGFVNFRDAKHAAAAAQAADGTDVFGCQKPVGCALQQPRAGESDGPPGQTQPPAGYAQAQKPPQQSSASETYSVKIQPLPVTFKQEDLASLLKKATSVRVIAGKGGTPGYGYANFDHRSDAQAAARQLTGADIGAGPIHASVKVAPAQQPSSRRPQPPTAQKPAAYDVDVDDEGDRLDDDDDEPDDEAVDDDDDGAADGAADGQSLPPPHALFRGSLGGNDDRDMNSERASRFALSAVRERSLSPPPSAQPVVKTDGAMLIGECSQMCPQVEIDERCRFKELDEFERPPGYAGMDDAALRLAARAFAVKKYKRSDAGSVQNVPDLVRPPVTLVVTFDHLVKHVVETPAKSTLEAYLFLWDRFRCIRKDFIMQNYTTGGIADAEVARVFEGMARYFIATEQALRLQPEWFEGPAHGKHNAESLSETLSALLAFYAMSFERSGGDEGALTGLDTEAEMTAYWLIFFLDNEGGAEAGRLLTTLAQTRPKLHAHAAVRRADDVRVARNDGNFAKFFQLISTSPYLVRCLALSLYEARTRDAALKLMRLAYGKREPYARADVARVLAYESEATLVADLDRVGCVIHGDDVYFDAPLDGGAASRQAAVDARRAGAVAAPFYAAAPAPLGRELAAVVGGCDKATREAQVAAVESQRRLQAAAAAAAAALRLRQYVEAQARKRADDEREAQLAAAAQQLAADEAQRRAAADRQKALDDAAAQQLAAAEQARADALRAATAAEQRRQAEAKALRAAAEAAARAEAARVVEAAAQARRQEEARVLAEERLEAWQIEKADAHHRRRRLSKAFGDVSDRIFDRKSRRAFDRAMRARVWLLVWRRKAKQRLDRRDRLDSVVMSFAKWRAYPAPDEASPKARWYDKYLRGFAAFAAPPAFAVSSLAITAPEAARPSALAAFGRKRCLPSAAASAAKKRTCDRALRYAPDLAAVVAPLRRAARRHLSALRAGATLVVAPVVPWKVVVVAGEGALLRWLQDALAGEDDREVSDAGKRGFLVAPTLVNAAVRVCVVRADEGDAALRGAAGVVIVVEPGAAALPTALLARCAAQGLLPLLVVHAGSDVPLAAGAGFKVACDLRVPAAALRGDAAAAVAALRALQVALTWLAAHAPPPPLIVLQTPLDFFAAAGGDVSAAIHAAAVHRMPDVYPPELVGTARSALRLLPHRTFTADEDGLPIDYADEKRSHNVADCIRAAAGDEDHMRQSLLRCFRLLEPLHFDAPTQPRPRVRPLACLPASNAAARATQAKRQRSKTLEVVQKQLRSGRAADRAFEDACLRALDVGEN